MQHATTTDSSGAEEGRAIGEPALNLRPVSGLMGVEVTGINLAEPFDDSVRDAILDAMVNHHILVFPNQSLTKDQQFAFTERFGEVEEHVVRDWQGNKSPLVHTVSNLDKHGNPTKTPYTHGNYFWHTDKSYHAVPSLSTLLHAIEIPPVGGGTQFCNMYLAYEELPEAMKARVADLRVVHSWEANRRNTGNRPATEEENRERPPVSHPMVRIHPATGRKALYIGIHTSHVDGMAEGEGRALLYQLLDLATQPHRVHTHHWRKGALVMWDNRCLLHRAVRDYEIDKHKRFLHRTVIKGTAPC
jgi:alpha-ketoglutarate-dependent taurine dioxygenase